MNSGCRSGAAVVGLALVLVLVGCTGGPGAEVMTSDAIAVVANQRHACALIGGGTVRCWGANQYEQLGDGTTQDSDTAAAPVIGVEGATSLSAGIDYSCAVLADGSVRCWGFNLSGQIGDGTMLNIAMESRQVRGVRGATAVAAGGSHACAVVAEGAVVCWGSNEFGQLGDGTTVDRDRPVPVEGHAGATALSAGNGFTCALLADRSVRCWGVNGLGQLGDGTDEDRSVPEAVVDLGDVESIASGLIASCAALVDGTVRCWGDEEPEVARDGSERPGRVRTVARISNADQLAVGEQRSCAVDGDGRTSCWGRNAAASSGAGLEALATAAEGTSTIAVRGQELCVVAEDGELTCGGIA